MGVKSPIEVIQQQGGDPDEVLKNFALWKTLCKKYDLNFKSNNDAVVPEPVPEDDSNIENK